MVHSASPFFATRSAEELSGAFVAAANTCLDSERPPRGGPSVSGSSKGCARLPLGRPYSGSLRWGPMEPDQETIYDDRA
jgi:hypothetical protein